MKHRRKYRLNNCGNVFVSTVSQEKVRNAKKISIRGKMSERVRKESRKENRVTSLNIFEEYFMANSANFEIVILIGI